MQILRDERPELRDSRLDFLLNFSYMYQWNLPFILFMSHTTEKKLLKKALKNTLRRTFLNKAIMCLIWLHLKKELKNCPTKHYWKQILFDFTVELCQPYSTFHNGCIKRPHKRWRKNLQDLISQPLFQDCQTVSLRCPATLFAKLRYHSGSPDFREKIMAYQHFHAKLVIPEKASFCRSDDYHINL